MTDDAREQRLERARAAGPILLAACRKQRDLIKRMAMIVPTSQMGTKNFELFNAATTLADRAIKAAEPDTETGESNHA